MHFYRIKKGGESFLNVCWSPTQVPLIGRLPECGNVTHSDLRFYHSVFPLCEGMEEEEEDAGGEWTYDLHTGGTFQLNADYKQEYVLHVHQKKQVMMVLVLRVL